MKEDTPLDVMRTAARAARLAELTNPQTAMLAAAQRAYEAFVAWNEDINNVDLGMAWRTEWYAMIAAIRAVPVADRAAAVLAIRDAEQDEMAEQQRRGRGGAET